jgi:CDP-4-dehydro-6-deoxyglucose reductase, E3
MTHRVTLQPSGRRFDVSDGKTVLTAGLEAGLNLAYSCRAGSCTTCRGKILEGKVDYGRSNDHCLTAEQRAQGYALLCQASPLSDLVVELRELQLHMQKPKLVPCRVKRIEKAAPDVAVIGLRLPYNDNMLYAAGQYVDFLLKDGRRRSYSIATAPALEGGMMDIDLHIRHYDGGAFTDHVFGGLKVGEILRFEGPLGTFYLREESDKPIVFLAGGTGFAPIKAMIEYALRRAIARPMTLYWGCRSRRDLYMDALPREWETAAASFRYVPVLSEPDADWTGRTGLVHRAVMADLPDLSGHQVYASGLPAMVEAARRDFIGTCGLPEDEFFADSFLTEAELAQVAPAAS